ncbi:MAG: response regulator [Mesonia hippocampi]|uniref:response regulator n=1 Tax=Mesonia hippocampi TaxID=1628250 RepID=UPI003F9E9FAB
MLRIAIADDHQLFRKSLKLLIDSFGEMQVVLEAANGKELLENLNTVEVDILLLDLQMPTMNGFQTIPAINKAYPEIKILVLTSLSEKETIKAILGLEVQGYFTKDADPNELKEAILKLHQHGFYLEKKLASIIETQIENQADALVFSDREKEIVRLILKEYSGKEIGNELNISPRTVEKHKDNLMAKTSSKNFIGVVVYVFTQGVIPIEELKI